MRVRATLLNGRPFGILVATVTGHCGRSLGDTAENTGIALASFTGGSGFCVTVLDCTGTGPVDACKAAFGMG